MNMEMADNEFHEKMLRMNALAAPDHEQAERNAEWLSDPAPLSRSVSAGRQQNLARAYLALAAQLAERERALERIAAAPNTPLSYREPGWAHATLTAYMRHLADQALGATHSDSEGSG